MSALVAKLRPHQDLLGQFAQLRHTDLRSADRVREPTILQMWCQNLPSRATLVAAIKRFAWCLTFCRRGRAQPYNGWPIFLDKNRYWIMVRKVTGCVSLNRDS